MTDTNASDAGHGVTVALRLAIGFPDGTPDGTPVGVLVTHLCKARDGSRVQDFIPVSYIGNDWPNVNWQLTSVHPISLTPSVSYNCCGLHGWVRESKWVPA